MSMITNEHHVDELIYAWMKQNDSEYTGGDSIVTASQMNDPLQIIILKKRYGGKLVEDAIDRIWTMLGSLFHKMIENLKPATIKKLREEYPHVKGLKREKRYECMVFNQKVSGQPDVVYPSIEEIRDYKFTTVYSHQNKSQHKSWDIQLNTLGYLLGVHDIKIKTGVIVAVFRDWHKSQFKLAKLQGKEYPLPEEQYEFLMWSTEDQKDMIYGKVEDILHFLDTPDEELPECTQEEMWADPDRWAVKRPGAAKARTLRNSNGAFFSNEDEAHEYTKSGEMVEFRPAIRKRCEDYCPVRDVCHQYKVYKEGQI